MGNNGVHMIDVCRWGLGVDYPTRVSSGGGKYRFDDDQETPDTNIATFDFGEKSIVFESRSWAARTPQDPPDDIEFFGEKGSLRIKGSGYTLLDPAGKEIAKNPGTGGNAVHLQNFVDAIHGEKKLNAEIEEGYKSALLCHLGNIAYRTGRTIHFDDKTKKITHDEAAMKLWTREYRKGWEPKV
jgi:predicted dehydrogenase